MDQFERTRMLLGDEAMVKLRSSRVAVFGVGGVGGYVVRSEEHTSELQSPQ